MAIGGDDTMHLLHTDQTLPPPAASPAFTFKRELVGHSKSVASVKFSPDGTRLASASADKTLRVWMVSTGELVASLVGHEKGCSDCVWSSDGRYLASASDDKNLHYWDVDPTSQFFGQTLRIFSGHTSHVFCCALNHPANNILASGSCDETVRLWDVQIGTCINVLPAHSDPVTAVQFSRDATILVTSSYDGLCRLWSVATGACLKTFIDDDNPPVSSARFSPNSKYLLLGTLNSTLRLWDVHRGKTVKVYKGHENTKFCLFATFATLGSSPGGGDDEDGGDVLMVNGDKNSEGMGGLSLDGGRQLSASEPISGGRGIDNLPLTYVVCGSEDCGIYVWDLQSECVVQRIAGVPALPAPEALASTASAAMEEGGGGNETRDGVAAGELSAEEHVGGTGGVADGEDVGVGGLDAIGMDIEGDGGSGSCGIGSGAGTRGDGDGHGHRDAVIGIDFTSRPGGGGVLASSGLEKDKTIKLWVTR